MAPRTTLAAALAVALLGACATERPAADATADDDDDTRITEQLKPTDARLETYRIDTWSAPSDDTLIVEALDGTLYRAQFMGRCLGLRFTDTIGFVTRGTASLDHFSGVVLPDGTRCTFRSFERTSPEQRQAEAPGKR